MIECLSDNRNRTVAEVRHAFSKCGGNLGTDGSVAYLFSKKASSPSRKAMKTPSWKQHWKQVLKTL